MIIRLSLKLGVISGLMVVKMEYLYSIFGENGVIEVYDDDGQIVQKAFKFE